MLISLLVQQSTHFSRHPQLIPLQTIYLKSLIVHFLHPYRLLSAAILHQRRTFKKKKKFLIDRAYYIIYNLIFEHTSAASDMNHSFPAYSTFTWAPPSPLMTSLVLYMVLSCPSSNYFPFGLPC